MLRELSTETVSLNIKGQHKDLSRLVETGRAKTAGKYAVLIVQAIE